MKKLAIVTTHPIQYYAPFFQILAQQVSIKVFYSLGVSLQNKIDPGFGKVIEWDIPLLTGYEYCFAENKSKTPATNRFWGINNLDIIKVIDEYNPQAILVFGWSNFSHLKLMVCYKGKIPVWFRGDSTLLDNSGSGFSVIRNLCRKAALSIIYRFIDKAFYVGTNNRKYFEWAGVLKQKLVHAPHAIDNERFLENRTLEVIEFRKKLNIPQDALLFLFAAKFEKKKDPMLLLRAFEKADTNGYLLIAGNGALENQIRSFVVFMTKRDRVRIVDFQNQLNMPVLYQAADVYCLPSAGPGETWGLAVNEAMISGCAICVSDKVGCAEDLVINGLNGYIIKAGCTEDWAQVLSVYTDRELAKKQGEKGREIARSFNYKIFVQRIVEQLELIN